MRRSDTILKMIMLASLNVFVYVFLDMMMLEDCGNENDFVMPDIRAAAAAGNSVHEYKNPEVIADGCSLTIVFVDPRINKAGVDSEIWHSLESMAANVVPINTTCVVIQTSNQCPSRTAAQTYSKIAAHAQPLFRSMIDMGNVRVDFIKPTTYPVGACTWNVNRLFMHPNYWEDEFNAQDSDLVIVLQPDSVFCHTFDVSMWTDLAFVGGAWPPEPGTHNNPAPPGGVCRMIPNLWKQWTNLEEFPNVCTGGRVPVGNGGFSLRSRRWMKLATNTCRSFIFGPVNTKCGVKSDVAEDLYFATALPGIKAPMPNPIEAALFGVEMIFLETVMEYYPSNASVSLENVVQKRWGDMDKFNRMRKEGRTIPIGIHKPWWYHNNTVLNSPQIKRECPYLDKILPSKHRQ